VQNANGSRPASGRIKIVEKRIKKGAVSGRILDPGSRIDMKSHFGKDLSAGVPDFPVTRAAARKERIFLKEKVGFFLKVLELTLFNTGRFRRRIAFQCIGKAENPDFEISEVDSFREYLTECKDPDSCEEEKKK
jgi:hypothetical protein